jgi:hypothetical protein
MIRSLRITPRVPLRYGVSLSFFLLVLCSGVFGQGDSSCTGYPNIGQRKINSIAIGGSPGNPRYVSMLQYTPRGYNAADFTKLYPVILYFPGNQTASEIGGVGVDPCHLIYDQPTSLPGKIANGLWRDSALVGGQWKKFIVLQFQYDWYGYSQGGYGFPSASSVDSVIDYALANYRVDPSRIYLTGMSAGSNIVIEYAASSIARAQRVAAITVASTCSQLGVWPNPANGGANIAAANLPVRFISCTTDGSCPHSTTTNWVNAINGAGANPAAELITLNGDPLSGQPYPCEWFTHNSWNKLYDSAFRYPAGTGKNLLEWQIQYSRAATVPVKLENYTARLSNGKVFLDWATSKEVNAESFTIEKAGADQRFTPLITIKANGNSSSINKYSHVDASPLPGINYYRLVQTDADNRKHYYETRKVMDARSGRAKVVLLPNPVRDELTTFINISRQQRVTITITDINGKVLRTRSSVYGEGNTGITIPTTELAPGIYFVRTAGEDFTDVQKMVKN